MGVLELAAIAQPDVSFFIASFFVLFQTAIAQRYWRYCFFLPFYLYPLSFLDFQNQSKIDCAKCILGKYKSTAGSSSSCSKCPTGYWQWGNGGNASCALMLKCAAGKYIKNSPNVTTNRICQGCAIARYSSPTDVQYSPVGGGVTSCKRCLFGKYQSTVGQDHCIFW